MVKQLCVTVVAAVLVAATAAGCGSGSASGRSQDSDVITFAVDSYTLGAPVFVAQEKGYFSDEGVTADTATFQTGIEGIQALSSGQVDFAFGLDFAAVSSASKNVVVLGTVARPGPGFNQMYFGSGIQTPEDLKGNKIGVIKGTAQQYLTNKWIEFHGLHGAVETVELPGVFELVTALKTKQVQAGFVFGTGVPSAQEDKNLKKYGDDSDVAKTQGIYVLTTRSIAEDDPELVSAVLNAFDKSADFIANDTTDAAQIDATAVRGDAQAIEATLGSNNFGLGFTDAQFKVLEQIQEFLKANGSIPENTDVASNLFLEPLRDILGDEVATP